MRVAASPSVPLFASSLVWLTLADGREPCHDVRVRFVIIVELGATALQKLPPFWGKVGAGEEHTGARSFARITSCSRNVRVKVARSPARRQYQLPVARSMRARNAGTWRFGAASIGMPLAIVLEIKVATGREVEERHFWDAVSFEARVGEYELQIGNFDTLEAGVTVLQRADVVVADVNGEWPPPHVRCRVLMSLRDLCLSSFVLTIRSSFRLPSRLDRAAGHGADGLPRRLLLHDRCRVLWMLRTWDLRIPRPASGRTQVHKSHAAAALCSAIGQLWGRSALSTALAVECPPLLR